MNAKLSDCSINQTPTRSDTLIANDVNEGEELFTVGNLQSISGQLSQFAI